MLIKNKKFYKKETTPIIEEIENQLNNNKIVVRDEQRPFKYNKKQMVEMYEDIVNGFRTTPLVFADVKTCYERAIEEQNRDDIEYFKYFMENGYEYTCEDGQHTITYTRFINKLYPELQEASRKSTINVTTFYNLTCEELTKVYTSPNKGRKLRFTDLVWAKRRRFNEEIKCFNEELGLYKYAKNNDELEKKRNSYKTIIKGLKVMLSHEGYDEIGLKTGLGPLEDFVSKPYTFSDISGVIDCIKTTVSYLNEFDFMNKIGDFTHYNIMYTIHILKLKGMSINSTDIVNFVNSIDKFPFGKNKDNSRANVQERYVFLKRMIENGYYEKSRTQRLCIGLMEPV